MRSIIFILFTLLSTGVYNQSCNNHDPHLINSSNHEKSYSILLDLCCNPGIPKVHRGIPGKFNVQVVTYKLIVNVALIYGPFEPLTRFLEYALRMKILPHQYQSPYINLASVTIIKYFLMSFNLLMYAIGDSGSVSIIVLSKIEVT